MYNVTCLGVRLQVLKKFFISQALGPEGNSPLAQWLAFWAFTVVAWVQSWVGELRLLKPPSMPPPKKDLRFLLLKTRARLHINFRQYIQTMKLTMQQPIDRQIDIPTKQVSVTRTRKIWDPGDQEFGPREGRGVPRKALGTADLGRSQSTWEYWTQDCRRSFSKKNKANSKHWNNREVSGSVENQTKRYSTAHLGHRTTEAEAQRDTSKRN